MNNDIPGPTPEEAHRVLIRTRLKIAVIDQIIEIFRQGKEPAEAYSEISALVAPLLS